MGKENDLTKREKGQIKAYYDQGLTFAKIGRKIGRVWTTISKFVRKKYNENERQNCGRKEKLTAHAKRSIVTLATKDNMSSQGIKTTLGLPVHKRTVLRVLANDKNVKYAKYKKQPILTKEHIQKRRDWAREMQMKNEEWF
ncbi:hypothetical protein Zmor_020551 [Zophobas morio]|uniref:Transposase IS30-like HTH domain-containing protein n=1 Tax=Zophobas morio TaxID=2755281 RepID=A0AA38I3Q9_9CUCU|nr:hypothetical protein Zmor_020551 [Zophobas morio]